MTVVDRWLQRYRMRVAEHWIPPGARVLDVGCHQGELLQRVAPWIRAGVGIDPLAEPREAGKVRILRGSFPTDGLEGEFDVITMLAVLEHLPELPRIGQACRSLLARGGRIIVTIPGPAVDRILSVLLTLRLIHGMSLEEHQGFEPAEAVAAFARAGLECKWARRFQCGLNNLYVFEHAQPDSDPVPGVPPKRAIRGIPVPG